MIFPEIMWERKQSLSFTYVTAFSVEQLKTIGRLGRANGFLLD